MHYHASSLLVAVLLVVVLCFATSAQATAQLPRDSRLDDTVRLMNTRVIASQWLDDAPFKFPFGMGHRKGTFKSGIHMNSVGNPVATDLRRLVQFPDDNSFVNLIVLDQLLTANRFAGDSLVPLNGTTLELAVAAGLQSQDKNGGQTAANTPLFGFWPQILRKLPAGSYWMQWSINLSEIGFIGEDIIIPLAKWIWEKLKLPMKYYEQIFGTLSMFLDIITKSFNLPSDSDDTGNFIALSARWFSSRSFQQRYPDVAKLWSSRNFNTVAALNKSFVETPYAPLASSDTRRNVIDTRTWAIFHEFFTNTSLVNSSSNAFLTTWLMTTEGEARFWKNSTAQAMMPFNVNNVDVGVACNMIYGLAASAISDASVRAWFQSTPQAQATLLSTTQLIAWALQNQKKIKATSLETLYYPSILIFPMFAARLANFLDEQAAQLPFVQLHQVRTMLNSALQQGGTDFVLSSMIADGECMATSNKRQKSSSSSSKNYACWDSFLGLADTTWNSNESAHLHDDRFFSTCLALNALIDTWTLTTVSNGGASASLQWRSNVPAAVQTAIAGAVEYIVDYYSEMEHPEWQLMGAFFSGSVKGYGTAPFQQVAYPGYKYLINGTVFPCSNQQVGNLNESAFDAILLGTEFMSESMFQQLRAAGQCGGMPLGPLDEALFNDPQSPWPFWSSEAFTQSVAMAGLAKWRVLLN